MRRIVPLAPILAAAVYLVALFPTTTYAVNLPADRLPDGGVGVVGTGAVGVSAAGVGALGGGEDPSVLEPWLEDYPSALDVPMDPSLGRFDPTATEVADLPGAAGSGLPEIYTYVVQEGDTLWDIAVRFGVSVNTVIGANPSVSPTRLRVGQKLRVLSVNGVIHQVKTGETLSGIAAKYKVDQTLIVKANNLTDATEIKVGQELIVPGATPVIVHTATVASPSGSKTVQITGEYQWPVRGTITSRYGSRRGSFHHGLDIAAPIGRTIVAARAGKVIFSGWRSGYGNCIIISHGDGVTTLYGHASKLLVGVGEWVEAGQAIAKVGSTGNSTGPHCHFEVRVNGASVNPLNLLP